MGAWIDQSLGKSGSAMSGKTRLWLSGLLAFLLLLLGVMVYEYRFPDFFELQHKEGDRPGVHFTETLVTMTGDMKDRWLPNDIFWPSILLDNPQNFQMGELEVVRYSTRVLRDNLSRLRTTDNIDKAADRAYTAFSNDPTKWIWPSAESKWEEGYKALVAYRANLESGKSKFYPRADNLVELLDQYISLLGGVTTRLSNIPSDMDGERLTEETAGDPNFEGEKYVRIQVNWWEIDNEFYYAQGVAFGLRQMLLAVETDSKEILQLKKATELLENILFILEHTQWEPKYMVMNCAPGSWVPCQNDPMMLGSRLQDVRQKLSSIVQMLKD